MDKKIVQFHITQFGQIILLYEDGSLVEGEMEHTEQGIKINIINNITI